MSVVRQLGPAEHSRMRFAMDQAATTFPGGAAANVVDPNLVPETAGELVARKQDPNMAAVDAQMQRVTGVLQSMQASMRGKDIAAAQTEIAHLAQALGSTHADAQPGQYQTILARAETLRGLVRNHDEVMLPAQRQFAGNANAALADRLLRRTLQGPEHFRIASSAATS